MKMNAHPRSSSNCRVFTALKIFMDINPQFFDECTANYKQQRMDDKQRQQNRDVAWQHLKEAVLANTSDHSKLPSNFETPIPVMEIPDISFMEDDYSIEGDEQMSLEGPSMVTDEQMEDADQAGEMHEFPNSNHTGFPPAAATQQHQQQQQQQQPMPGFSAQGPSAPQGRVDHVRRKSVIPISADVMRE